VKVLAVDADVAELAKTAAALKEVGHEVRTARSDGDARALMAEAPPQVMLIDAALLTGPCAQLVRHLRGLRAKHYVTVFATGKAPTEAQLCSAFEAGCDAELRLPMSGTSLRARLRTAERLGTVEVDAKSAQAWVDTARGPLPPKPAPALPEAADTGVTAESIARTSTWRALAAEVQAMATTLLTLNVTVGEVEPNAPPNNLASGIILSNVEHQLELRVALAADSVSANALAVHMFGEAGPGLEADMLGEITNQAMGVLKSSFGREHFAFTGGLPEAIPPGSFYQFGATCPHQVSFALVVQGARILVRVGVRSKRNSQVLGTSLVEGMVLAKDVFNARGMLLLAGGTRLSLTAIERLRGSLAPKQLVEVAAGSV
jgi:CheY-like chemotaxis protein